MKQAKSAASKVARLEEKLEDFEKRVSRNGSAAVALTKKISSVENQINSADSSINEGSSKLAQGNKLKIEAMETRLEELKLEVAKLKMNRASSSNDVKGSDSNGWFDAKFHAFLEAPKARKVVQDWIETKLHTHKVILVHEFFVVI